MKKVYFTLIVLLVGFSTIKAQLVLSPNELCQPDTAYAKEEGNIYPEAYHERLNPDKGTLDSACINQDYSFIFTAVVPDSFPTDIGTVKLDYIKIEENGLIDVPTGIKYKCNPPSCDFKSGTLGCLELYGKPEKSNEVKVYDLKLKIELSVVEGLIIVNDTLPTYLTDSAHYYLPLFEEGSVNCKPSSIYDIENDYSFSISPNPVSDKLKISISLQNGGYLKYSLVDLYGKVIRNERKLLNDNTNIFYEDVKDLIPGVYFIKTEYKHKIITQKFIIY